MYNPMPAAPTAVSAWVSAAQRLDAEGDLHGLMLHIENPTEFASCEEEIVCLVDSFLRKYDKCSISTVANTIFPAALDRGDGIAGMTKRYLGVYERRIRGRGGWGRYFERMVAWKKGKGTINQIEKVIERLRGMRMGDDDFYGNVTEIALYDPRSDIMKLRGRQCLSFIELKPMRDGRLHMMVVYRNHYYVERALGNLIGLGRLLDFIAREAGFNIGTLTIQSTHACLDPNFNRTAVRDLIKDCAILRPAIAA